MSFAFLFASKALARLLGFSEKKSSASMLKNGDRDTATLALNTTSRSA
jgi:hypothetical protein